MILHYFKIAYRALRKYSLHSLIGIIGLSIGFLSFMLCSYYVQYHLLFNTQIPNADRMYKLTSTLTESELKNNFPEIEKMLPIIYRYGILTRQMNFVINIDNKDVSLQGFLSDAVKPSFIDFFSFRLIHGTKEMITRNEKCVVLFESQAKTLSEDISSLIGKELKFEDDQTFFIAGIMKDLPENSRFGERYSKITFYRLEQNPENPLFAKYGITEPTNTFYIQLYKNTSKRNFLSKVDKYFDKEDPENKHELEPFTGLSNFGENQLNIFKFLLIFGLLILLSTLSHFILFQLSLYYNRLKEYGIRIVNGVNRWQFTWHLFVDIGTKFLLSCLIVFLIMDVCFPVINKTYHDLTLINLNLQQLRVHLMQYVLFGLLLSFLFSSILSRNLLKLGGRSVFGNLIRRNNPNIVRKVLLIIQLITITIFISAAGIVKLQVDGMKRNIFSNLTRDERESILTFPCSYTQLSGQHDLLFQKIKNSNHVLDVTCTNEPIISMYSFMDLFKIRGIEDQVVRQYQVALNFFDFFNGQIIQGDASESSMNYYDAVVVNKYFQKLFPGESLIGKTFEYRLDRITYRIVGVVDNVQLFLIGFNDGTEDVNNIAENEALFFKGLRTSYYNFYVKYKSGQLKETKQHIESCLKEFIPESYNIEFQTIQEMVDNTYRREKLISLSSVILFLISLILGLLNIYSSVMMSVEKRKKEIAIRKINGAEVKNIIFLMGKSYFVVWTLACLVSFPFIYFYATRWLERYRDPVSLNILLFVVIYVVILLFITLTVLSQIIKTVKSNPAEVVKQES